MRLLDVRDILAEDGVTETEMKVALNVLAGLSNNAISQVLTMKVKTVKWHFSSVMKKTDTKSRAEFIVKYLPIQTIYLNSLERNFGYVPTDN